MPVPAVEATDENLPPAEKITPPEEIKLPSIKKLISDSWALYASSFKLLILVIILPILATLAIAAIIGVIIATILAVSGGQITPERLPFLIPPAIVALIALLVVNAIGKIILIKAIELEGKTKIKDLINIAWPLTAKYIWLQILVGLATIVGFILLIIPGVIISIWFMFSSFILVTEGLKGVKAIKQSRQYVKGKFWGILGRVAVLVLVLALFSGLGSLIENDIATAIIQLLFTFIVGPLSTIYSFKLYQGAKALTQAPLSL